MPWTNIPATGTLSYGDGSTTYTFDPLYRSNVSGVPEYDEARRTVVAWAWTIEVDAWVTSNAGGGNTADTTLATMRQILTKPGGILHYDSKGFSTFAINTGGVFDVAW